MAIDDLKEDKKTATVTDDKKENKGRVADYLQAPRKKRKSYVVAALGPGTTHLYSGIEAFLRSQFKNASIAQPKSIEELVKNFSRQVILLVLDDEFTDLEATLQIVAELKRKKSNQVIPTLFLTRQPQRLVTNYHKILSSFQESDDYIDWGRAEITHIFSKIRNGLNQQFARKSRRFKVDIPIRFQLISDDQTHYGRLIDLSIHGALLKTGNSLILRNSEQLKMYIPTMGLIPGYTEEFLRISGKVRRVFITGIYCGVSFEYLSDNMQLLVTTFVTNIVMKQLPIKGRGKILGPNGQIV